MPVCDAPLLGAVHAYPGLEKALGRVLAYVLGRQSPQGGFCFYRNEYLDEPNLSDTWCATTILADLLRTEIPRRSRHAEFVIGLPIQPQAFALYHRVGALQCLGWADPWTDKVRMAVMALPVRAPARNPPRASLTVELARLGDTLCLKRHFQLEIAIHDLAQALLRLEHADGGFGTPPNLLDTAAALAALDFCGVAASPHTADFVQRMAVPGFGFRLAAGSFSPNLETACAGMSSCRLLGLPVPHADDAVSFILSCQSGSGGFARAADALPDLTLTHLALSTLAQHVARRPVSDPLACADGV